MIEQARAEGVDITADMYPYTASGTGLTSLFPPWAHEGGRFYQNIRDPEMRARIRDEALHPTGGWDSRGFWGPENIVPIGFERDHNKRYTGMPLSQIAAERGQPWVDAALDLLADEEQRIATIYHVISEDNIALQLRRPWVKISTDAGGLDPAWAAPQGPMHPRAYGTYPRVLARYVRQQGIPTWEDAIRRMTWAVAARLGLRDRGLLQPGAYADVVILNPETITDRSTFQNPHQLSTGVRDVWVNGHRVVRGGDHTGATPGRVVRGPGHRDT